MNTKSYLRIDGVEGDSLAAGHLGDIDIVLYSWGSPTFADETMPRLSSGSPTNGVGVINVTKSPDKASYALNKAAVSGDHFSSMLLIVDRDPYGYVPFMIYEMIDVIVFSLRTDQISGGTTVFEQVIFKFNSSNAIFQPAPAPPSSTDGWTIR
jgi:type VI secretion system secreted protein Hcp